MTTLAYAHNFAAVRSLDGARVELDFDLDRARWPWLVLPPQHPVLVEKYQYFAALTAGWASGSMDPHKFTALTRAGWSCPPGATGYATQGVCHTHSQGFELEIFDAQQRPVASFSGEGAVIEGRDFKAWRAQTRQQARDAFAAATDTALPSLLPARQLGQSQAGAGFISALWRRDGIQGVDALVTADSGFVPGHPWHTGSGDHVNAAHLIDCAMQMAHLLIGACRCHAGQARFVRFVELDVPFSLQLQDHQSLASGVQQLSFACHQLGRENCQVQLELQSGAESQPR